MSLPPFGLLESAVVHLPRDDVDTDQIIPARFLTTTTRTGLGRHLFADWRYDAQGTPRVDFALNAADPVRSRILVVGRNFGCGSSREHAPWALLDWGFRAVIATSFADIFRNNALKNGLLTIGMSEGVLTELHRALDDGAASAGADPGTRVCISLANQTITAGTAFSARFAIDPFAKHCLLHGVDELGYLLAQSELITAFEKGMPAFVPTTGGRATARAR